MHPSTRGPNLGAPWSCRGSPHDALSRRTLHARRDAMVLCRGGDSHPSCDHPHPSAQGHGYSTLLLVRNVARHRRVMMRGVDAAPCVSASRPSYRAFRLQVRARVVGLKRTPALRTGARSFWMPRHHACGRRALLAAPPSLRAGLRAVPDWVDRGSSTRCRPGKRTPAHKPNRHRRRRRRGAAPERECAARLGRGRSASSL
jgi:hypothetical protein